MNAGPQRKGIAIARNVTSFCLLLVGITSAGSISFLALIQARETKDSYFSRLGTDLALASSRAGLIADVYKDSIGRTKALEEMISEYLIDERISCIELRHEQISLMLPPKELCAALRKDDIIQQSFGANPIGTVSFYVSHERLDAENSRHLLYTIGAFMLTGMSFIIASIVLMRHGMAIKDREAVVAVKKIFDITPSLLFEVDASFNILRTSKRLMDYINDTASHHEFTIDGLFDRVSAARVRALIQDFSSGKASGPSSDTLLRFRSDHNSGYQFSATVESNPIRVSKTYFIFLSDISAFANEKTRLTRLLRTDFLTGALSRRYMEEVYADGNRSRDVGLMMIDVDFFKSINDNYGHEAGDRFLKHVLLTLQKTLPPNSEVIRLSGEEFLAILDDADSDTLLAHGNKIRAELGSRGISSKSGEIIRTVSVGISRMPQQGKLSESLRIADHALAQSKHSGRNKATFISDDEYRRYNRNRPTTEEVESAVLSNQITLHCEPVYDYSNGLVAGFESLLRWQTKYGWIPPVNFLDAYYHVTNRISGGKSRFELFAETASHFSEPTDPPVWLSYNLWPGDIHGNLLNHLNIFEPWLRRRMVLEVSEKLLLSSQSEELAASVLRSASEAGCQIALDDFGVEGSNLSRLHSYPVDIVKIDKALVTGLKRSSANQMIIESISNLAAKLGIAVIAEGVESSIDAELLAEVGVVLHQGYWYGKAMPAKDAKKLCAQPLNKCFKTIIV